MCTAESKEATDILTRKGLQGKPELIAEALYTARPEAQKILDVGYAQHPNRHLRGEVYGVDIVTDTHPDNYRSVTHVDLNTCSLPFSDQSFDAVTMGCVLAHVSNPLGLLIELHRVLKPNGVIILSSPNPNYYWEQVLNVWFHFFKSRVGRSKFLEHFYEFTRYNMRTIADRAGFSVTNELGVSLHIVKLGWTFQPKRYPGIAYEIVYTLEKTGEPELYTICELPDGHRKLKTTI